MKRLLLILAALLYPALAHAQFPGSIFTDRVQNSSGTALPGVNVSVCTGYTLTGASVASNFATLTLATNPLTDGFTFGSSIFLSGFTGADSYLNGTWTISGISSTQIIFAITHANATTTTLGNVVGIGTTACFPLSTIYTDPSLTVTQANPFTSDSLGNVQFWDVAGYFTVQYSGTGLTSRLQTVSLPCVVGTSCQTNVPATLPNTTLPYSSIMSFFATTNAAYTTTLTGDVTSSSITGAPPNGTLLGFHICQDGVGSHVFAWPSNVLAPTTIQSAAGKCSDSTFKFDGTNWSQLTQPASGGGGGGSTVGNIGTLQKTDGAGNHTASNCVENLSNILQCLDSFIIQGPSPNVSIGAFGGRVVSGASYATGQLIAAATCNSNNTLTSVGGNTLQVGDGIAIYGCGVSNTMSTPVAPTLTPSIAATRWHTGFDVPQPAGGVVNYCVKIAGVDSFQGISPASPEVCANTFPLGPANAAITSASRSGTTITFTLTSGNPLTSMFVGQGVCINTTSNDTEFGGCFTISAVTSTTFSVATGNDAAQGAAISATGGTAWWAYDMHITLPAVSGTTKYYLIYVGASGAEVAYGWSLPFIDNVASDISNLVFQDFGSSISKFTNFAPFVPTNPPTVAVADTLLTTVVSTGAGTITMANAASQNITSTVRLDENAILNKAIAFAQIASQNNGGMILLNPANPALGSYIFNTPVNVPSNVAVSQAATVTQYDTITVQGEWFGDQTPNGAVRIKKGFARPETVINCNSGYPCLLHRAGTRISGVEVSPTGNGVIDLLYTGSDPPDYDHVNLVDSGSPNCNVVGWQFANNNAFGFDMRRMSIESTYQPGFTNCDTPMFISKYNSEMNLQYNIGAGRGYFFKTNGNLKWDGGEEVQGGGQCTFTFYNDSIQLGWVRLSNMIQDTIGAPLMCIQGTAGLDKHDYEIDGVVGLSANMPLVSGNPVKRLQVKGVGSISEPHNVGHNTNLSLDTIVGAKYQSNFQYMPGAASGVGAGQLANPQVAPSPVVTTTCPGGHPPAGGHNYQVVFFDALGSLFGGVTSGANHSTSTSPGGSATVDGSTQCVNIPQPTPPVGAVFWYVLRDGYEDRSWNGSLLGCTLLPISTTTFQDQDSGFNACTGNVTPLPNTSFLNGVTPGGFNGINLGLSPIPNPPAPFSGTNLFHVIADGWPSFNVNGNSARYFLVGLPSTVAWANLLPLCTTPTTNVFTLGGCGGSPGAPSLSVQYNCSGALCGAPVPTSPNNVTQNLCSTPVGGVGTTAIFCLPGVLVDARTTTSETIAANDRLSVVTFNNSGAIAVTLPQAGSGGGTNNDFTHAFGFKACDIGAGTATITPTVSTISYATPGSYTSGAASMPLTKGQCAYIYTDASGANYVADFVSGNFVNQVQTNTVNNSNQNLINFINPANFNGLTFTWSNPSGGQETFAVGGTLGNAGLTNPSTTVNGQTCTLGSTCTIPGTTMTLANAASVGTTLNTLTTITGAPATAVIVTHGALGGAVGITTAGAGTTGSATITTGEQQVSCVFDGATVANDYVQISGTVDGNCHDAGAPYPASGQVIGRVQSTNAAGGTFTVILFPAEIRPTSNVIGSSIVGSVSSNQSVTLAAGPSAAQYQLNYYADQNALCTSGSETVSFTFNWTDNSNARSLTTGNLTLGSAQSPTTGYLSGSFIIKVNSGNVTYTSTFSGACASGGPATYDINASLVRIQ